MCGIAGVIDQSRSPSEADIGAMIACIDYRGPDGMGCVCLPEEGVGFGHRRLSILDLSEAGHQPMESVNRRYLITYNGEIYNYLELRRELQGFGHVFRSGTDTEVLLSAYEQWGAECVGRCMGMYAFAIWDRQERTLFAARDRLGIKPFYFRETSSGLAFASEIKSILALEGGAQGVQTNLIDAYMDFGYVPGEETLHRNVRRLLPGHTLRWKDGRTAISSYWDLQFDSSVHTVGSDCATQVRERLQESIALHLRSDVPLGVFLSGGLDSSAVVALLAQGVSRGLKTFSVAYDFGPQYDETPYAREVARAFGTDHHEIRVKPSRFAEFVPEYIWHMDEPVTEAAAISLHYVSRLAREQVVVCLSGEGSDELFAGYDFYSYNLAIERARRIGGAALFSAVAGMVSRVQRLSKFRKYLRLAALPLEQRYRGISSYEQDKKLRLYSAEFANGEGRGSERCASFIESLFNRSRSWDDLSKMLYFDTKTWLVDDLLIKADRMSMVSSIELRVPFLDHRLVEYAASIPSSWKIRSGKTKYVLKKALQGLLPDRILNRCKMGFPTPLELMFRGELYSYAWDLLMSKRAIERGYFSRMQVEKLLVDHRSGRSANHREIWQLVVLEEWHRRFGY